MTSSIAAQKLYREIKYRHIYRSYINIQKLRHTIQTRKVSIVETDTKQNTSPLMYIKPSQLLFFSQIRSGIQCQGRH